MKALGTLGGADFLREWHARYAGTTSDTFWCGRLDTTGGSTYELLVEDVASLKSPAKVIDLACGDGYLLELLARRLPAVALVGVDVAPQELDLARRRSCAENVALLEAPGEALPLPDRSADAVVCHMALMLFDDARAVIQEVARVLRPGGIFAAVLGPAKGSSDLVARFGAALHQIEAAENLAPLTIGDPATYGEPSLRALFEDECWHTLDLKNLRLRFDAAGGSDERISAMLLGMYNVARLSEQGRDTLKRRLETALREQRSLGQPPECVLGLRHLVASRSA